MASILCFRMHQKTTDTEYGVVHYETESGIVKRPNGKSVEQTLSECVLMEPVVGTQVPGFNIDATSFAGKSYDEVIADAKKNVNAVTLNGMTKDQIIAAVPGYVHPSTKQCSYAYSHPRTKQCSYEYIHPQAKQCNYEVDIEEIAKNVKEKIDMSGRLVYSISGNLGVDVSGHPTTITGYNADYIIVRLINSYSSDTYTANGEFAYIMIPRGGSGYFVASSYTSAECVGHCIPIRVDSSGNVIIGEETHETNKPHDLPMHVELYKY